LLPLSVLAGSGFGHGNGVDGLGVGGAVLKHDGEG
jgi:hypothetical protein